MSSVGTEKSIQKPFRKVFSVFKDIGLFNISHLTILLRVPANITIENVCALPIPLKISNTDRRRKYKQTNKTDRRPCGNKTLVNKFYMTHVAYMWSKAGTQSFRKNILDVRPPWYCNGLSLWVFFKMEDGSVPHTITINYILGWWSDDLQSLLWTVSRTFSTVLEHNRSYDLVTKFRSWSTLPGVRARSILRHCGWGRPGTRSHATGPRQLTDKGTSAVPL
jgi:hypothetical protein